MLRLAESRFITLSDHCFSRSKLDLSMITSLPRRELSSSVFLGDRGTSGILHTVFVLSFSLSELLISDN